MSERVSRVSRPHQHIIGHFRDESFQSITCTGTENLNRTTERHTRITQNNTAQKGALVNSTTDYERRQREPGLVPFTTSGQETEQVYFSAPEPAQDRWSRDFNTGVCSRQQNVTQLEGCIDNLIY